MLFIVTLIAIVAVVFAKPGAFKGLAKGKLRADFIKLQSVVGSFPSNPEYASTVLYQDADCTTVTQVESVIINICLSTSKTGEYQKFACADNEFTSQLYTDNKCTQVSGSPVVFGETNSCIQNSQAAEEWSPYVIYTCDSTSAYSEYVSEKWDVQTFYQSNQCASNEVVSTTGYIDGFCYSYGSSDDLAYIYSFPDRNQYATGCVGNEVGTAQLPTYPSCDSQNDDGYENSYNYNTYQQWSQITSVSCDSSPCPTSCPGGYYASESWSLDGCDVYCQDQPTNGQCQPGGSGCTSSCKLSPGVIAGIVIGVILVVVLAGILLYRWYCLNKTPMSKQEVEISK